MAADSIPDPDASRAARLRWGFGEAAWGIGGLAFLGLLVVLGLTAFDVIEGWAWPTVGVGAVALGVGALVQRGMEDPVVHAPEMRFTSGEEDGAPAALVPLVVRQDRLAARLLVAVGALSAAVGDPSLGEVVRAGQRVAFLAGVDLRDAVALLAEAEAEMVEDMLLDDSVVPEREMGLVQQAGTLQDRVDVAVAELEELVATLGPVRPDSHEHRQQRALEELSALNDWVAHRQQALRSLSGDAEAPERHQGSAE